MQLKLILRPDVLGQGLGIMAGLAQALPVCFIPEQRGVATVRFNVIYDCGRRQLALALALGAQRVRAEERFADLSPAPIVDVVLWSSVVLPPTVRMCFTVLTIRQVRAAGNGAGMAGFIWHGATPL
ncbi:MAG: hypothetical protein PHV21_00085 [Synergistaceae bacterium]|nr:hypothetical protein [Synergistaceae bacterium]